MKLLAEGRASEIFDLGDGRVLRRFKRGGDPGFEARVMEHARAYGFPVPAVLEVRDDGLVLERVDGPTMNDAADLEHHPAVLARLHAQLHEIPFGDATLLHRDLHPENVILSPDGPVVVDWTNAGAGEPAFPGWEAGLEDAIAYRAADPNVTDDERAHLLSIRNH